MSKCNYLVTFSLIPSLSSLNGLHVKMQLFGNFSYNSLFKFSKWSPFQTIPFDYVCNLTYFTDVDGVPVPLAVGVGVHVLGILPGLGKVPVVPDVAVVREAVRHKPQLSLLHVLLDGVERLLEVDLHLCVAPPGDLHHHVEHFVGLVIAVKI
jgi:hypothetical protein